MKFTTLFVTALASFAVAAPSQKRDEAAVAAASAAYLADPKGNFDWSVTPDFAGALEKAFSTISAIPDSVLEAGDDATETWLKENGFKAAAAPASRAVVEGAVADPELAKRIDWVKVAKCVATVTSAIATNIIPATKLLKIKKLIGELGGVKSAIQLMIGATTTAEKLKVGGEALVELSKAFLGITAVEAACF